MLQLFRAFLQEDEGQDLVEYALLVALIAIAVAAAFPPLATAVKGVFSKAEAEMAK